jgi:WD40 repeat protein
MYLSTLPFLPAQSRIALLFQTEVSKFSICKKGKVAYWPAIQQVVDAGNNDVNCIAYSPDGKQIVSGSSDNTIRIWDAETGILVSGPFEGHTDWIHSVAYSPDGKKIVSGSSDKTIRIWDSETGILVSGPFEGHTGTVWSVGYSPDGKKIVSGSSDNTIRVWDAETGILVPGLFEGHTDWIQSVAYSPDGKKIVSGSEDNTIRVWDAETGILVSGPFEGHTDWIKSVAYSPDGKKIVSSSEDNTIRVWDAEGNSSVASQPSILSFLPGTIPIYSDKITFNIQSGWILGPNKELLLWIPPWHRDGLYMPKNSLVIAPHVTMLDYSKFVHGTGWYNH